MAKKEAAPPAINLVLQPDHSSLCLAACVAMVSGETLATVVRECVLVMESPDFEPWMSDAEASRFLATRELSYGLWTCPPKKLTGKERSFSLSIRLDGDPAIVSVDSLKIIGGTHAVVWCPVRRQVLDPQRPGFHDLSEYKVTHWTAIESLKNED